MTFEITGFDGVRGMVLIETEIGRFWVNFTLIDNSTVSFGDVDTLIDDSVIEKSGIAINIELLDLEEFVLESEEVQEQIRENRFFSDDCHGNYYDYYGVSSKDFY